MISGGWLLWHLGKPRTDFVMRHILHGSFAGQAVLIDEISFMSVDLLGALEPLKLKGVRIICFGDFLKLPPASNHWRGCQVPTDAFERILISF